MRAGEPAPEGWAFFIDRGGTFTDVIGQAPDGRLVVRKLLSENKDRYADAATEGVRAILAQAGEGAFAASVRMGTTVATNALLERKGAPTVLAITQGHADALLIGDQARPRLFDRRIVKPAPLYAHVVEVDERVLADGRIDRPLDEPATEAALRAAYEAGYRSLAIVLMHGYRYPAHEERTAAIARRLCFTQISVSHEASPLIKLVGRGDTTVADAYLSPVLDDHVRRVTEDLGRAAPLYFMQSNGGLTDAARFRGKDAVLSGPAGGVVGMARTAAASGLDRLIGFDMGGTSTDVAHYAGTYERTYDTRVAGVRLRAPMMSLHTVAAGGGSICRFDGSRLRVGPESAGADPGPACYRRGGPLTITDCNLLLGRLQPDLFPKVFGPQGDQPLDVGAVRAAFARLALEVETATGHAADPETLAEGFIDIAVQNMARAIKQITIERGRDIAGYTLVSFGGAGGQHACKVAQALGVRQVMLHPLAGVLSAYGIGLAGLSAVREQSVETQLTPAALPALTAELDRLETAALAALAAGDAGDQTVEIRRLAQVKAKGSDTTLTIAFDDIATMTGAFQAEHRQCFGFAADAVQLIVETLTAEALAPGLAPPKASPCAPLDAPPPAQRLRARFEGEMVEACVYPRETLTPGMVFSGPAIVTEPTGTTVVEAGWTASVDGQGALILRHTRAPQAGVQDARRDPVRLELFNNLFMAVAEEMGQALQNTAHSVNIKERLDFSCALFDEQGNLIANAPHMPVHLGSMGDSVRAVARARAADGRGLRPGDVYMLNAPYNGGTHLPDVTVIAPVFAEDGALVAFVAARGHHGDIGGITPGSMPPMSQTVEEEGVLIDNVLLAEEGRFLEAETRNLLASGDWPARNPDQNIADLKAQVAACRAGGEALRALIAAKGLQVVQAYMGYVQDNAEEAVRRAIDALADGAFRLEMDDGAVICVAVRIDREKRACVIDFGGSSPQRPNNFNAPWSVCRAAVLYVFRTLIDDDIPLNDGCMRPITLRAEKGSMLNPQWPAAVVAGNVETSQAITDALYGALGGLAASQGTMNNFTFGDAARQYYETVCGGAGAGEGFDGASAVQTHMTNSRLTDPEVLETRYPVVLEAFAIRRGSGGAGRWRGGDGVVRRLRFLQPMTMAILSNRRRVAPFGAAGGADGALGRTEVIRGDGSVETLGFAQAVSVEAGDVVVLSTPGGGGYGLAEGGGE